MNAKAKETVSVTIDDQTVEVPHGINVIEAARTLGIEIPHYCYHRDLTVAGNCRMCQVELVGRPNLEVACNIMVQDGMKVRTHLTSEKVARAQASTLELILINHPMDCTVCDQAGHCKLQDYHYIYNAKHSRFREDKVKKVKAKPLGPNVMLDGERCIMCTRCIRFCDEVTETSELGMLNRGDRSVITVSSGRPLANPLSGTVVDLCPVGALTHRHWRFNTRVWFTRKEDSICPGCSTGCSVKVFSRDGQVVNVKARYNKEVNKEWLCDEGRYGFHRFLPEARLKTPLVEGKESSFDEALERCKALKGAGAACIFLAADLTVEEYYLIKELRERYLKETAVCISYRTRKLSKVEEVLISPDYAPNFRGAEYEGLSSDNHEESYEGQLASLREGRFKAALFVGERAVLKEDLDEKVIQAVCLLDFSAGVMTDGASPLCGALKVALPGQSPLEKSGLMINRNKLVQYLSPVVSAQRGSLPEWEIVNKIGERLGGKLTEAVSSRDLTLEYLKNRIKLEDKSIADIKRGGFSLNGSKGQGDPEGIKEQVG